MKRAMTASLPAVAAPLPPAPPRHGEDGGTGRWATSSAVVAVLHAGALAAAVLWHPPARQAAPPPAAMMIELAPMAAPAAPPSDKAPGVERAVARPVARNVEEPAKPEPVVKKGDVPLSRPKPKPVPKTVEEAPPTEKAVAEHTTAPPSAPAPLAPTMAAPAPGASAAAPSNAVPTWQGTLRAHLERYKRYPATAQLRRQEGVATVRFAMTRDGTVQWARLERASGVSRLDDEALALMERAQPLPPPPPEISGEPIEIVVPVQFFLK